MTRSTAYDRFPEHRIEIDPPSLRVRVQVGDLLLAESVRALRLREDRYPPIVYIPREDVRMERLQRSPKTTHCPFKGDASYYDPRVHETTDEPAPAPEPIAWSYEDPFDQVRAIRDHLAFYADRVSIETWDG